MSQEKVNPKVEQQAVLTKKVITFSPVVANHAPGPNILSPVVASRAPGPSHHLPQKAQDGIPMFLKVRVPKIH